MQVFQCNGTDNQTHNKQAEYTHTKKRKMKKPHKTAQLAVLYVSVTNRRTD